MIDPNLYSKYELEQIISSMKMGDPHAMKLSFDFVLGDSERIGHGRKRAKMCRAFKYMPLEDWQKSLLVRTVQKRLQSGKFSQQFKDQLVMAIRFDPQSMRSCADRLLESPISHVARYALWTLMKIDRLSLG